MNIHDQIQQIPFFRPENMAYYEAFSARNPHFTAHQVVLYVNIGLMYNFYERIFLVEDPMDYRVLVNKFNRSPANFSPNDLVAVAPDRYLRESAAHAFFAMQEEMAGLNLPIIARSAYRSYAVQRELVEHNLEAFGPEFVFMWNAQPGHSEHQLGLAVDILLPGQEAGVSLGGANFQNTAQYAWLLENAHRFGFILSYPYHYSHVTGYAYEPWHWRFIGEETATYMFDNNIPTFDHYWATRIPVSLDHLYINNPIDLSDDEQTIYANGSDSADAPFTSTENSDTPQLSNTVLLSIGETDITLTHASFAILGLAILIVFASIFYRKRNRRGLARQYDFQSRTIGYNSRSMRNRSRGGGRRYR